jgi:hypothetical protein
MDPKKIEDVYLDIWATFISVIDHYLGIETFLDREVSITGRASDDVQ